MSYTEAGSDRKSGLTVKVLGSRLASSLCERSLQLLSFGDIKRGLHQSAVWYFCILKHTSVFSSALCLDVLYPDCLLTAGAFSYCAGSRSMWPRATR